MRVEGVEEVVKSRLVSMMYELACENGTVAVAKLSCLCEAWCLQVRGVSEYVGTLGQ